MGQSLNNAVLLGIVIALGMLVDDAIVVVESMNVRLQKGVDATRAAIEALKEVIAPVTSSVLTTAGAYYCHSRHQPWTAAGALAGTFYPCPAERVH